MRNKAAEKYVIYHTIGSLPLADRVIDRLPEIISEAFVVSFPECCADMRQILIHTEHFITANKGIRTIKHMK